MKKSLRLLICGFAFCLAAVMILPSYADNASKKIAIVMWNGKSAAYMKPMEKIKTELVKKGYSDANISVYYPDAANKKASIRAKFKELNTSDYDVIVSSGTGGTKIGKSEVTNKPLVFFSVTDPVASKIVASWEDSGNNLTGVSIKVPLNTVMYTFTQVAPDVKTVGVIHKTGDSSGLPYINMIADLEGKLGVKFLVEEVADHTELKAKTEDMCSRVDGFFLQGETIISTYGKDIVEVANAHQKPTIGLKGYIVKDWGATVGNVVDFDLVGVKAAQIIDKVANGATPSSIPSLVLDDFPILINIGKIEEIGLDVSFEAMEMADELIEE